MEEEAENFSGNFYSNLRSLNTLVDHLRDAGLHKYIKLPRIVVLGVQSAGKSSVLQSIVGLNFLPRGEGICTRRPLQLRLVHTFDTQKPWAQFQGIDRQFSDFDQVRQTIEKLTDQAAGRNKGIIDDPIILSIYSNTCPDLTLIDLPGITRIPLAGSDHPHDIERVTKEMAYKYISDPRTIILCVIAGNVDISISEGLLMARKVDKSGIRTLGVITKIDIMDRGTNARRLLLGQEVPLRLGYVGIKNRSQQDIRDNMRVQKALQEEKEFFSRHEVYSTMPPGYLGTDILTQKLTKILFNHIKHFLPEILKQTMFRIKEADDKLRELGPSTPVQPRQKVQLLWNLITDFCEIFKNNIRGKFDRRQNSRVTKDLAGGATIKQYFNTLLEDLSIYKATEQYTNEDIQRAMSMHQGDSIPGFPSVDVFIFLLQPQLQKLKQPVLDCLADVHSYLEQLAHKIIERIFYRFPSLAGQISHTASQVLHTQRESCRVVVQSVIEAEESYIFTNDLEYLTKRTEIIPRQQGSGPPGKAKDPHTLFLEEIRSRIDAYFALVVRNVRDTIPKIIGTFLVRSVMDKMQLELYQQINMSDSILNHLSEPSHITAEREMLRKQLQTLRKAQKILKHDPQLASQAEMIEDEIRKQEEDLKKKEEEKAKKKVQEDIVKEQVKKEEQKREQKPRMEVRQDQTRPVAAVRGSLFGNEKEPPKGKPEKSLF